MAINRKLDFSAPFRIESRAPTRIDLAGGTIDLWPLYLFLERPLTINLGIDLFAEATLTCAPTSSGNGAIRLRSEDQGSELKLSWGELATSQAPPALDLHAKLLRHFASKRKALTGKDGEGFEVSLSTRAKSPAGAGLGGSSALSIAMIGALASWARGETIDFEHEGERLIEVARDVETTVINVPAGIQDYYGAMFGGLQSLSWGVAAHSRQRLPQDVLTGLEDRLLLFYSGQSRNSGINNWALFKGFIDRQEGVRAKFESIARATVDLEAALGRRDWEGVGAAISREWAIRKTLAEGITTPAMERAFAQAQAIAPVAGKICGAGGGGCFFVYSPALTVELRSRILQAFVDAGIRPLPFKAVPGGLEVQIGRE